MADSSVIRESMSAKLIGRTKNECAQIVREEWRSHVLEFNLPPFHPTAKLVARILDRINNAE